MSFYNKHVFFCTNQKDGGKKCCANANAMEMWQYAKQRCKQEGLLAHNNVRISQSGCMGRCADGPCLVVYPEGRWYSYNDSTDIDKLIEAELIEDEKVEELLLNDKNE